MPETIFSVQLFATCLVDVIRPAAGLATLRLLERLGVKVIVPSGQTCCGQPAFNSGCLPDARAMARYTVDLLEKSPAPIVVPSGSCGDMIVHRYRELLADDPAYASKAERVAARTYELSQYLSDVLKVQDVGARCRRTMPPAAASPVRDGTCRRGPRARRTPRLATTGPTSRRTGAKDTPTARTQTPRTAPLRPPTFRSIPAGPVDTSRQTLAREQHWEAAPTT